MMYIVRIFICIKLSSINAQASANSSHESLSWSGEPVVNGFNQLTVGNVDTLSVTLTVPVDQMISVPSTLYLTGFKLPPTDTRSHHS